MACEWFVVRLLSVCGRFVVGLWSMCVRFVVGLRLVCGRSVLICLKDHCRALTAPELGDCGVDRGWPGNGLGIAWGWLGLAGGWFWEFPNLPGLFTSNPQGLRRNEDCRIEDCL